MNPRKRPSWKLGVVGMFCAGLIAATVSAAPATASVARAASVSSSAQQAVAVGQSALVGTLDSVVVSAPQAVGSSFTSPVALVTPAKTQSICSPWHAYGPWWWFGSGVAWQTCVYYAPPINMFYRATLTGQTRVWNKDKADTFRMSANVQTTNTKATYTNSPWRGAWFDVPPRGIRSVTVTTYPPHLPGAVVAGWGYGKYGSTILYPYCWLTVKP